MPRLLGQEAWITKVRVHFGGSGNFTVLNLWLMAEVQKFLDSLTIMNMRSGAGLNRPHKSLVN